jgi:serine/threonine-protein kinase
MSKDPEDRWQTALDVMKELQWVVEGGSQPGIPAPVVARRKNRERLAWGLVSALAVGIIITLIAVWTLSSQPTPRPVTRFPLVLPTDQRLTGPGRHIVALSPDGRHLVYTANNQLYLRAMDQLEATPMRGTEDTAREPFFSPDGQWVGFYSRGQLKKVSINGGAPVTLCDALNPWGASWGEDDTIVFGQGGQGIFKVPATGGTAEVLVNADSQKGELYHGPQVLPGGKAVLFTYRTIGSNWDDAQIVVQSLETGERQTLIEGGTDARYLPTGHLVYAQVGTVMAVPFDLTRLEVTGGPVPVVEGVAQATVTTGAAHFSVSSLGSLVYVPDVLLTSGNTLVWVDRNGREQPFTEIQGAFEGPRLSPDGNRLAITIRGGGNIDVWIYELVRGTLTRFTFDAGEDETPIWTPDGQRVAFTASRGGERKILWRPADGSAPEELLQDTLYHSHISSWSPDGKVLAFEEQSPETGYDIWTLSVEGERQPVRFLNTSFEEHWPRFSPDGQWIAYMSDESGRIEIYVQPYPGPGGKWQISSEGGTEPVWSPKGDELFYRNGNKLMVVNIESQPTFNAGTPHLLFEKQYEKGVAGLRPNFDVAPDGERFVMVKASEQAAQIYLTVVLNWFEELKRLVPTDN